MQLKYFSNLWWIKSMILVQMRRECWTRHGSLMQPMTFCLPWLKSYRCYTELYARLWKYLSSYREVVGLFVWILFIWYQKLKFSCWVVFRSEGTFGPTAEMLSRGRRTNPLTWEVTWIYNSRRCFLTLSQDTFVFDLLAFSWWKDTLKLNMFWELICNRLYV
jgi:hypothetical protein